MTRIMCQLAPAIVAIVTAISAAEAQVRSATAEEMSQIPFSQWVAEGEVTQLPWRLTLMPTRLRPDQRIEKPVFAVVEGKELAKLGETYDLYFSARIADRDGQWLGDGILFRHEIHEKASRRDRVSFGVSPMIVPGDYTMWLAIFEKNSGKRSVARRDFAVEPIRNDPLPEAFDGLAPVQFPRASESPSGRFISNLAPLTLLAEPSEPVHVDLLLNFSTPEQWLRRRRVARSHIETTSGAASALGQMGVTQGTVNLVGLDLARREVIFEQEDIRKLAWFDLMEAVQKMDAPVVSTDDLRERKSNGAFFRDILAERLDRTRVHNDFTAIVVVSSSLMFERGSDLQPLAVPTGCNCRIYHIRFRLTQGDVFDDLEKFMKPFKPRTFNVYDPEGLRRAIAAIMAELEGRKTAQ